MEIGGAYNAERAAALSGVPKSTVHYWARHGHLEPSVATRPRLWSFTDLLALRTIYWLRQTKKAFDREVPATSMPKVQRALKRIQHLELDLFEDEHAIVAVTLSGEVVINTRSLPAHLVDGQYLQPEVVDILGPFEGWEGAKGPDLRRPRPTLRIVPQRISGAPHIDGTRLQTQAIYALKVRGFTVEQMARLYPFASLDSLNESIALEQQLQDNIKLRAA